VKLVHSTNIRCWNNLHQQFYPIILRIKWGKEKKSINNNTPQRRLLMNYLSSAYFKYVRREPRGGIGIVFLIFRICHKTWFRKYKGRGAKLYWITEIIAKYRCNSLVSLLRYWNKHEEIIEVLTSNIRTKFPTYIASTIRVLWKMTLSLWVSVSSHFEET